MTKNLKSQCIWRHHCISGCCSDKQTISFTNWNWSSSFGSGLAAPPGVCLLCWTLGGGRGRPLASLLGQLICMALSEWVRVWLDVHVFVPVWVCVSVCVFVLCAWLLSTVRLGFGAWCLPLPGAFRPLGWSMAFLSWAASRPRLGLGAFLSAPDLSRGGVVSIFLFKYFFINLFAGVSNSPFRSRCVFSFPPQMQLVVCFMVLAPLFFPHFPYFFHSPLQSNGAANYDEKTGSVGVIFADTCNSEYSKRKKKTFLKKDQLSVSLHVHIELTDSFFWNKAVAQNFVGSLSSLKWR